MSKIEIKAPIRAELQPVPRLLSTIFNTYGFDRYE